MRIFAAATPLRKKLQSVLGLLRDAPGARPGSTARVGSSRGPGAERSLGAVAGLQAHVRPGRQDARAGLLRYRYGRYSPPPFPLGDISGAQAPD